jgi:hypothetical protein
MVVIETTGGKVHAGVLIEESGLAVTLGVPPAERIVIPRADIKTRVTEKKSAMPAFDRLLAPAHVADITAFLVTQKAKPAEVKGATSEAPKSETPNSESTPNGRPPETDAVKPNVDAKSKFGFEVKKDRLIMTHAEKPLGEYVWGDTAIRRPFFANFHGLTGTKITRNHPPLATDSSDHGTMHPGIWLGFGQISGVDFWRNQGRIQHVKFLAPPTATEDRITFATDSDMLKPDGKRMGTMVNRCTISRRPAGWLLVWDATFTATEQDLVFVGQGDVGQARGVVRLFGHEGRSADRHHAVGRAEKPPRIVVAQPRLRRLRRQRLRPRRDEAGRGERRAGQARRIAADRLRRHAPRRQGLRPGHGIQALHRGRRYRIKIRESEVSVRMY